uniref:MADF domain-containing protein n=1 Tax=Photinus pyralis TaxID=7054 RepID=A0A1Y1NJ70_PHOPY
MAWSQREVCVLIEEYKKHPCLYAVKSKQYTNKHLRQKALEDVEAALISIKPHITINEIKTKFNGLKTTFAAEHKKHLQSFRSGAGNEDDVKLGFNTNYFFMCTFLDIHAQIVVL